MNLFFIPKHEPNRYVSRTVWSRPGGQEFHVVQQTHDVAKFQEGGEQRDPKGTMRMHALPAKELYRYKPGRWKVELFLDDVLARRCQFVIS